MPRRTSTELAPDGSPVVRHLVDRGGADSLRREATLLELARGPGVVELVAVGDEPDGGASLTTRYLAGGTLADLVRDGGEPAATAALARVAGTLADLHERGIVHGRCTADHVVGGASGASLCGFSGARAAALDEPADPQVDRSDFATLVTTTLRSDSDAARRARRAVAGLAAPRQGTNLRTAAAELWALARDDGWVDPASTGATSAHLARDGDGAPEEEPTRVLQLPGRVPGGGRRRRRSGVGVGPGRSGRLAAAAAAVAGCLVLIGALAVGRSGAPPTVSAPEPVAAPGPRPTTAVTTPGAARLPEQVWPPGAAAQPDGGGDGSGPPGGGGTTGASGHRDPDPTVPEGTELAPGSGGAEAEPERPPPRRSPSDEQRSAGGDAGEPGGAPAEGDGRPQPASPPTTGAPRPAERAGPDAAAGAIGGAVVESAGVRYEVGAPGDLVVLGDWDCDGTPTPSVVRPTDGSVWTFPNWTTASEVAVAEAVGVAPSPVAAVSRPGPDGCDALAITTAAGDEVIVRPAGRAPAR
jgi:hypothetical protein